MDRDENVLRGVERLLREAGLTVSSLTDPARVRDQVVNRYIPIVLCDLDTPKPDGGIELLQFIRQRSPMTSVVVMTGRPSFDAVAGPFRAGAKDVVPKTPGSIAYLRQRMVAIATEGTAEVSRQQLLGEVTEVHEEFLKKMMELARHLTDLEDRLLNRDGSNISAVSTIGTISVLLVDDEPGLMATLQKALPHEKGWRLRYAQSGGEALDAASQTVPDVLVVKEQLPDLPGTMVVKTIKAGAPDVFALLFTPPGDDNKTGEVKMVETSRMTVLIHSFSDTQQLVDALDEIREALKRKSRERRYLQSFRKEHFEFLKRYQRIKQRLATAKL